MGSTSNIVYRCLDGINSDDFSIGGVAMVAKKGMLVVDDEILLTETLDDFFKSLGHEMYGSFSN